MENTPETPLRGATTDSQLPEGNWYNWRNYAGKRNPKDSVLSPQGNLAEEEDNTTSSIVTTTDKNDGMESTSLHHHHQQHKQQQQHSSHSQYLPDSMDTVTNTTTSVGSTPPSSRHKKLLLQNPPILSPSSAVKYSSSSFYSSSSSSSSNVGTTTKRGDNDHPNRTYPSSSSSVSSTTVLSFWEYISRELGWGLGLPWYRKSSSTQHVINFLSVPLHLEPLLLFGHAICFDMFLFQFTLLPVRCCIGIYTFLTIIVQNLWDRVRRILGVSSSSSSPSSSSSSFFTVQSFTRAHAYDIIRMFIIIVATIVLGWVQVSRVYHYIRGEAIIKLYVIFNILEIFDKLMSSLGTDIMDALYRTTRDHLTLPAMFILSPSVASTPISSSTIPSNGTVPSFSSSSSSSSTSISPPPTKPPFINGTLRLCFHILVAICYCIAHALILFIQIVCLNVAINSRNNALLTLMISNNFVELKSSVFRRFESENLFQVTCADIVERFQLVLFLGLISLQELSSWNTLLTLFPSMLLIFACEIIVDYVKYSFISKFNCIHTNIFSTFKTILAHDLVSVRSRIRTSLDPTHTCVKRLGLATLPLTVVVYRMILLKLTPDIWLRITSFYGILAIGLFWCCLLVFKSSFSMVLLSHAAKITSTIVSSTVGNHHIGLLPHHPPISALTTTTTSIIRTTSTGSVTINEPVDPSSSLLAVPTVVPKGTITTMNNPSNNNNNNGTNKDNANDEDRKNPNNPRIKTNTTTQQPLFDTLSSTNRYSMKGGRIPL